MKTTNSQQTQRIKCEDSQIYSFDIFDTLVTRKTAAPEGIFILMQEVLKKTSLPEFIKNNFHIIRKEAEGLSRRRNFQLNGTREITFDDIYGSIGVNYNLTKQEIDYLKELEIQTEKSNLVLLDNINILIDLVRQEKKVVLISDMYFSSEQIRGLLKDLHPVFQKIKIYVSGEMKTSKATGGLYSKIKELENLKYKNWTHFGDNLHSDIKMAKKFGISTKHLESKPLLEYQKYLLNAKNDFSTQLIVGASRLACLKSQNEKFIFGASYAAPLLYNYVNWILEQSIQRGFKTLYFIARDGYIPQLIADRIIKKRNLNIKTKYIFGSRKAWRIPDENSYDLVIEKVFSEYDYCLNGKLLAYRLGLSGDKVRSFSGIKNINKRFSSKKRKALFEKFKTDSSIKNYIIEENKNRVDLLIRYLVQEIEFTDDIAFVDLHGSGNTQKILASHLNKIRKCNVHTFYLTNYYPAQTDNLRFYSYILTNRYLEAAVELLSKTAQGQTIGYKEVNNQILPVTEEANGEAMLNWGLEQYVQGILTYTDTILDYEKDWNVSFNELEVYTKFVDFYRLALDEHTALILASIPYSRIGNESGTKHCAHRIRTFEAVKNFFLCRIPRNIEAYPNISYYLSSQKSRCLQDFFRKYPTIQKFLFNIYYSQKAQKAKLTVIGINIDFSNIIWR